MRSPARLTRGFGFTNRCLSPVKYFFFSLELQSTDDAKGALKPYYSPIIKPMLVDDEFCNIKQSSNSSHNKSDFSYPGYSVSK